MSIIIQILGTAFALLLVSRFVPGISVDGIYVAILAALIIGVLNVLVKPILFVLTLPITIITFGLFTFVLNAFMFWLAASFLTGFSVSGFLPALVGSIIVSAVSTVLHRILT
jgi:putative membrane protein